MTDPLASCPLDIATDSCAAWLWRQCVADGEYAIPSTVCRAVSLVRLATDSQELEEWRPVFDLARRHFAGAHLRPEVLVARGQIDVRELDEDGPTGSAWRACEQVLDAFDLVTSIGRSGTWWADCASIAKWSMQAARAAIDVLQIPEAEAIAICDEALDGTKLADHAATAEAEHRERSAERRASIAAWTPASDVADLLRPLGAGRRSVEDARGCMLSAWWASTTDLALQLAVVLRGLPLPAARRHQLLVEFAGPLVEHVPAASRLARRALDPAALAHDRRAAFGLAMGIMQEGYLVARDVEERRIASAHPRFPSVIWHIAEVCAVIALETPADRFSTDLPAQLAQHLTVVSSLIDPDAPSLADRMRSLLAAADLG